MNIEAIGKNVVSSHSPTLAKEINRVTLPIFILIFYWLVEYAKPAFLAPIKPGMVVQILLILCLISYPEKIKQILQEKYFRLYLLFLAFMTIHVFIAINNYRAIWFLQLMFSYLIIGISFGVFIDNANKMIKVLTFYVLIMSLCAIDRIVGGGGIGGAGFVGAYGVMGDENDFALAMNVVLPISYFLGRSQNGWMKWFFVSASVLFVLANIVSSSRGGVVGLVVVVAVCWLFSKHKLKALSVIAVLTILAWNVATPVGKEKIMGLGFDSVEKDTGKDRIELWKTGWRAFIDNPVLGVGQGNMPIVINKYQFDKSGESYWRRDMWGRQTHSIYFTMLPEWGFVGLIIFGLMLKNVVVKYNKIRELCKKAVAGEEATKIMNINIALLVSLLGFLVSGIFLSALYYPQLWNISALIVTLFIIASRLESVKLLNNRSLRTHDQ